MNKAMMLVKNANSFGVIDMTKDAVKSAAKATTRKPGLAGRQSEVKRVADARRKLQADTKNRGLKTKQSLKDKEIEANHKAHGITGLRSIINKQFGSLGKVW